MAPQIQFQEMVKFRLSQMLFYAFLAEIYHSIDSYNHESYLVSAGEANPVVHQVQWWPTFVDLGAATSEKIKIYHF